MNKLMLPMLLMAIASSACTRQAEKKALVDASLVVPATVTDTKLPIKPPPSPEKITTALKFSEVRYSTVEYFRLVDSIQGLSEQTKDDQIAGLARSLYEGFYANESNYTRTKFEDSLLTKAIVGEGEPEVRKQGALMDKELRNLVAKLSPMLLRSQKTFPWPKRLGDLSEAVETTDQYVAWLTEQIPTLQISHAMQRNTVVALRGQYEKMRPVLLSLVNGMKRSRRLKESLVVVSRALREFKVKLKPREAKMVSDAQRLAAQIDATEDAQGALALLITVWRMQDPADRGAFKKISPEMHDFLAGKSDDELDCLSKPHCMNPVLGIQKMVIFRKLNEYGIEKLTAQVDKAAHESVVNGARAELTKLMPELPVVVKDQVEAEAKKFLALIATITKDVIGFARPRLSAWTKANFLQPLRGLEVPEVTVTLAGRGNVKVSAPEPVASQVRSGAAQLGLSLTLAHKYLPEDNQARMKAALMEPLMKLLAIGGFRMPEGRPFPSLLLALDGGSSDLFDIKKLMGGRTSYAVPDSFVVTDGFMMNRASAEKNVSVGAQAELLRGISRQIKFHRDWESNQFDTTIGKIRLNELLRDLPGAEAIDGPMFPKDIMFALSLGNAGAMLQNLILELSPAFLLLDKGEILWGDRYQEIKGGKVSTVAALVSIVKGRRGNTVKTADVARYVLALDEFMAATEGMEQTGSSLLKEPTNEGKSTLITDLVDIRKKLMLLQMGLTNYLVYVAQQQGGSFSGSYELGSALTKVDGPLRLEDQVLPIRALLASASRLELPLFRWAALDAFYGMNKSFFDPARQFYASELGGDGKPAKAARLLEIVQTLHAGEELSAYMPTETRQQWERLSMPWLRALQEL